MLPYERIGSVLTCHLLLVLYWFLIWKGDYDYICASRLLIWIQIICLCNIILICDTLVCGSGTAEVHMKTLAKFLCHHWQLRDCFSKKKKHSGMIALPIDCLAKFAELRHQSNAYRAILHHNTFFPWTQQKEFVKICLKQCSLHYMNSTSIRTSWNSPTSCKISNINCNPHIGLTLSHQSC